MKLEFLQLHRRFIQVLEVLLNTVEQNVFQYVIKNHLLKQKLKIKLITQYKLNQQIGHALDSDGWVTSFRVTGLHLVKFNICNTKIDQSGRLTLDPIYKIGTVIDKFRRFDRQTNSNGQNQTNLNKIFSVVIIYINFEPRDASKWKLSFSSLPFLSFWCLLHAQSRH